MPKDISQKADDLLEKLLHEEEEGGFVESPEEEEESPEEKKEPAEKKEKSEPKDDEDAPKKVNGWKNRQTWNVALWMNNDEGLYNLARSCGNYKEFADTLREYGMTETPDHVAFNDSNLDIPALDDCIAELGGSSDSDPEAAAADGEVEVDDEAARAEEEHGRDETRDEEEEAKPKKEAPKKKEASAKKEKPESEGSLPDPEE